MARMKWPSASKQPWPTGPEKHLDDDAPTPKEAEFIRPGRQEFMYGHEPKKSWVDDNAIITTDKD